MINISEKILSEKDRASSTGILTWNNIIIWYVYIFNRKFKPLPSPFCLLPVDLKITFFFNNARA